MHAYNVAGRQIWAVAGVKSADLCSELRDVSLLLWLKSMLGVPLPSCITLNLFKLKSTNQLINAYICLSWGATGTQTEVQTRNSSQVDVTLVLPECGVCDV